MKQVFTKECRQICRELETLMAAATPVSLCQIGAKPLKTSLEEIIEDHQAGPLLVFKKKEQRLELSDKPYFVLFKKPRKPIRGFHGTILTDNEKAFTMAFPEELFEIQHLKEDRIPVHQGTAVFHHRHHNGSPFIQCEVLDVSMQAAKLFGSFPASIKKDTIIEPLSMMLCLRFSEDEMLINIRTATVKHVSQLLTGKQHIGVTFDQLSPEMNDILEDYLSRRQLETLETARVRTGVDQDFPFFTQ